MAAALIDAMMLLSRLVQVADYSLALLSGLLIGVVVIEAGRAWALATYAVAGGLGLLLSGNECALLFLVFFGYYPVLKPLLERLQKGNCQLLKMAAFNAVVVAAYVLLDALILPEWGSAAGPVWQVVLLLFAANAVFLLYDMLFDRVMCWYWVRVHPALGKLKKGR